MSDEDIWIRAYCAAMAEGDHGKGKGDRARRKELADEAVADFRERFHVKEKLAQGVRRTKPASIKVFSEKVGDLDQIIRDNPEMFQELRNLSAQFESRDIRTKEWIASKKVFIGVDAVRCKICDLWVKRTPDHFHREWQTLAINWVAEHKRICVLEDDAFWRMEPRLE